MKWNNIVSEVQSIRAEDAKTFIQSAATNAYQLIDVRQPQEYNKEHLAGAILAPLNELMAGAININKAIPTLVYSREGERSVAAAQWLITQGYTDVQVIEGGLNSWNGYKASGHAELNLKLIKVDAEFPDALSLAFAMEEGLRLFYIELARETKDDVFKKLYRKMASFEVEHKQVLSKKYSILQGKELIQKERENHEDQLMEGGGYADITLIKALANTNNAHDIFSLGLAMETQALDFYTRLARQATDKKTETFFLEMADEEKKHLAFISSQMDQYLAGLLFSIIGILGIIPILERQNS